MLDRLRDLAMKELLVHHPHRFDTRSVPPREKEKILRRHFGLE